MAQQVIVIGAGVAGLATAGLLEREGYEVTVVEKNDEVGGRAGQLRVDGFRFETGPSWYLMPDAFDHFFELMGTTTAEELDLVALDPAYRLFPEGQDPIDVPAGQRNVQRLFESIEPGAGERLHAYLAGAAEVYQLAMDHFLYTTFERKRNLLSPVILRNLPRLAVLLLRSLESMVAAQFTDVRLRQMLTYPAVFLSGRPEKIPSMYHLMSHTDLVQGVAYPRGGFTAVVEAMASLARKHGARFLMNTEVRAIIDDSHRAVGVRLADDSILPADIVVSCADLHHTETTLLAEGNRTYPQRYFDHGDPGIGTVLAFLGVRGELPELTHHNLLFSREWGHDFDAVADGPTQQRPLGGSQSIYVCKPSTTDPLVAPSGHENLFVLIPVPADPEFGYGDAYHQQASPRIDALVDAAIEQISQWAGIPELGERVVVKRSIGPADFAERYHAWSGGSVGPAHTLAQSAFFRASNKSVAVDGLYYAGATVAPGVGIPMCLISAENVVKWLRGDQSTIPLAE